MMAALFDSSSLNKVSSNKSYKSVPRVQSTNNISVEAITIYEGIVP